MLKMTATVVVYWFENWKDRTGICLFQLHFLCPGGNFTIFVTITCSYLIQQPVYYFLSHLSLMDRCYTTTVISRLIRDLGATGEDISYNNCMTQLFTAHSLATVEMFILVSMAFDRYIAVVRPLHYMVIMCRLRCPMLITVA
ncbi:Olfactory Receptor 4P4 [Manis pentadactyla]|nr:Olfactory Receptor 4P4 [Manis pentadactyla]